MPGPIPNRSGNLSRERDANRGHRPELVKGTAFPVTIPEPDAGWHPIATMLWESLTTSGQSAYYQDSDWAFAYSLCDDLSYYKKPLVARDGTEYHKRSGQMLQTIYSAMDTLLVTEGARRRARVELEAPEAEEDDEADALMNEYESELGANVIQFPAGN